MTLYPLMFKPRFVEKMWGGRKIETVLNKPLPRGLIGESWELYDFPPGVVEGSAGWISSEVSNGVLAGQTLHQLVEKFGSALYGKAALVGPEGQFPILIKFLDANQDLSVQVHPDEAYARANAGAHLKNEAWYVVQADAGSRILKGLKPGVTREKFEEAVRRDASEAEIQSIPVKAADFFYLPSGTVHALGAGILAAEVQTPSDTTYRVFDFNRVDPSSGAKRKLHVEQALKCIDFSERGDSASAGSGSLLATCEQFSIRKVALAGGAVRDISVGEPIVWMVLKGSIRLDVDDQTSPTLLKLGDTVLLPASLHRGKVVASADSLWLEVTFPKG